MPGGRITLDSATTHRDTKLDLSLYGNKRLCRKLDNKDVEGTWISDILQKKRLKETAIRVASQFLSTIGH